MKQAIMIIAHNNSWTLKQIIKTLDSNFFDFFIMIDKKSNIQISDIERTTKFSNIECWKSMNINWGEYSQTKCEIELLKNAMKKEEYQYYHLISGNDFPIQTPKNIYEYFFKNYPKEFVNFATNKLPNHKKDYYFYKNYFMKSYKKNILFKILNKTIIKIQKILKKTINDEVNFRVGCNWFSITNKFANYIIKNEKWIENVYQFTRSSDESFIQTLLYNSAFINNLYNSNFDNDFDACKRLIDWKRGNPYTFTSDDYNEIINSNEMFVRKVNENKDKELIEKLIKHILE